MNRKVWMNSGWIVLAGERREEAFPRPLFSLFPLSSLAVTLLCSTSRRILASQSHVEACPFPNDRFLQWSSKRRSHRYKKLRIVSCTFGPSFQFCSCVQNQNRKQGVFVFPKAFAAASLLRECHLCSSGEGTNEEKRVVGGMDRSGISFWDSKKHGQRRRRRHRTDSSRKRRQSWRRRTRRRGVVLPEGLFSCLFSIENRESLWHWSFA